MLVNNAGAMLDMRLRQMGYAEWSAVLRSNLDTLFNTTKQVVDGMADRGWGRIINIGSVAAEKGQIGQVNYATAKGAAIGFTRSLAQEVGARRDGQPGVARLHRRRHGQGLSAGAAGSHRGKRAGRPPGHAAGPGGAVRLAGLGRGGLRDGANYAINGGVYMS